MLSNADVDEYVKLMLDNNTGVFQLSDGRRFASFGALDESSNCFVDARGREYVTESQTIGCIRFDDMAFTPGEAKFAVGHAFTFSEAFAVESCGNGVLRFGEVRIDTSPGGLSLVLSTCWRRATAPTRQKRAPTTPRTLIGRRGRINAFVQRRSS